MEQTEPPVGDAAPLLDSERQRLARRYAVARRWLLLADLALSFTLLLLFWLTGASQALKGALQGAGLGAPGALVASYVALAYLGYRLALSPLAWVSEFRLPHAYGLSTQRLRDWLADQAKLLALGLLLGVPLALAVYWLFREQPTQWWLWAGALLLALSVLLNLALPVLLVPLFYRLTPLADAALRERIEQLAARAGQSIVGVYTIDLSARTTAANALVMGLGRTRRIALGDTLYTHYSADEIVAIVAHELGHQVHRDLELELLIQTPLLFAGLFLAQRLLAWATVRWGFEGVHDVAALPLLALVAGAFSLVTMPLGNAYSRWRERRADAYALAVTGNPGALKRAFTRLANQNLAELDPPRWIIWLLYSHPPLRERLARASTPPGAP